MEATSAQERAWALGVAPSSQAGAVASPLLASQASGLRRLDGPGERLSKIDVQADPYAGPTRLPRPMLGRRRRPRGYVGLKRLRSTFCRWLTDIDVRGMW